MPYRWTRNTSRYTCQLWPHNTLNKRGFAAMVLIFFFFSALPLIAVLGTRAYWGLLPFSMGGVALFWIALRRNRQDRHILETLEIDPAVTCLHRQQARKSDRFWDAPTYWTKVTLYPSEGPVPQYVTLKNRTREVEIGAFLSEEERVEFHQELRNAIAHFRS